MARNISRRDGGSKHKSERDPGMISERMKTPVGVTYPEAPAYPQDGFTGLTKREYFAAMVLQGICENVAYDPCLAARHAVVTANFLIKALNEINE